MGKRIILLYHRVNSNVADYNRITVKESNFKKHLRYLSKNVRVLSIPEILSYEGSEDAVAITFDDGFCDTYNIALPIIKECCIPATIFLCLGRIENNDEELWTTEILRLLFCTETNIHSISFHFLGEEIKIPFNSIGDRVKAYELLRHFLMSVDGDTQKSILEDVREKMGISAVGRDEYRLLSSNQILELAQNDLITLGAHTINHQSLGLVEKSVATYEIEHSINMLSELIGYKVDYFAYPFGGLNDYNTSVFQDLGANGIKAAFTTSAMKVDENNNPYTVPRYSVEDLTETEFQAWLQRILNSGQRSDCLTAISDFYYGIPERDENIKNAKRIIVWGCGKNARDVIKYLRTCNMEIEAVVDNDENKINTVYEGIRVSNLYRLRNKEEATYVIKNTHDIEIVKQLKKVGINKIHVWA